VTGAALGVEITACRLAAAPVDLLDGGLIDHPTSARTPASATPDVVMAALGRLADAISWAGPIGVGFPGVVDHGIARTAAGLDPSWLGVDVQGLLRAELSETVTVVNDADAVGIAEVRFGAAYGHAGVVVVVVIDAGIGTSVLSGGRLVPNTELGHLPIGGHDADELAVERIRAHQHGSWAQWAGRLNRYLRLLEDLLWPSLIVIGGLAGNDFHRYGASLDTRSPVVPARLSPNSAIIGAALGVGSDLRDEHERRLGSSSSTPATVALR
jgi:polyphosphate glucokinase